MIAAGLALMAASDAARGQQTPRPGPTLFRTVDGSVSAPSRAYLLETTLGSYRISAATEGYAALGTLRWQWSDTLFKVWTAFESVGDISTGGAVTASGNISGANVSGATVSAGTQFSGSGAGLTNVPAAQLTGNLAIARFNSGTGASGTTYWRGDGTWATPLAGGGSGLPSGLIVISLTGSCPSGFTRTAALDGFYPRGDSFANVGLTSGAESHDHGMSHSHTVPNHQHGFSVATSGNTGGPSATTAITQGTDGGLFDAPTPAHTHPFSFSYTSTTDSGGPGSTNLFNANTGAGSSRPPTKNVVFCAAN